jgi:flagellar hook-associated protein 1 FlgK
MSGLFDSLTSASHALDAQRMGLDVVGQNLANVNTPGYARRRLILGEVPPTDPSNAGRGVEVLQVQAQRDIFIENRLRNEQQGASFTDAQLQNLSSLQAGIGLPGQGLDASLAGLFDSFSALATDVTSVPARDAVVAQGKNVAQSFNTLAQRIQNAQLDADGNIRASVAEINDLAKQVAQLNGRITSANGSDVEALRDQRNVALSRLSELAGVTVTESSTGAVTVSVGPGNPLVVETDTFTLDMSPTTPSAMGRLSIGGVDITNQFNQWQIGGLLQVRDTILPGYMNKLDQMAYDIATQVNAVHSAGFDAAGNPAGDFFVQPGAVAGAAAAMAVDPGVAANSQLVAGSLTGAAGDNQTATALAALRNQRVMSGGTATPSDAWGQFVYTVGADISSAQSQSDTHDQVVLQLQKLRDSASGVSMDEEAAWLMKYQRAYEASARYFTTVNSAIDTLMAMVSSVTG